MLCREKAASLFATSPQELVPRFGFDQAEVYVHHSPPGRVGLSGPERVSEVE